MRRTNQLLVAAVVLLWSVVALRAGAGRLDSLTALAAVVTVAAAVLLAAEGVMLVMNASPSRRGNVRLVIVASFGALVCLEAALRLFVPRLATYSERNHLPYRSQYKADERQFHAYFPGQPIQERKPEFDHVRTANQLGLADTEIAPTKAPNEYRILALGDSFTEGVGASADATWVRVMQRAVQAQYPQRLITTVNAGVSGSDPFAEYHLFKGKLLPLRPDLVIVAMNSSDLTEVLVRGGSERFQPDGTQRFRPGPFWEPVYAVSYSARLIVHNLLRYNFYLIPERRLMEEIRVSAEKISGVLEDFQRLCAEHGVELLLVVHPTKFELLKGTYDMGNGVLVGALQRGRGLRSVDLLKDFLADGTITRQNAGDFYWTIDLHHNERGYELMGRAIARHVRVAGPLEQPKGAPASAGTRQ